MVQSIYCVSGLESLDLLEIYTCLASLRPYKYFSPKSEVLMAEWFKNEK
jgi:hypothetical protein